MSGGEVHVRLDTRRIEVHTETGVDTWKIDRVRRASKQYGRFWVIHFEDAARLLALVPMRAKTTLVLWHLIGTLHSTAWTRVIQSEVQEAIGVERSAVSKALAELRERHIIVEHGRRKGHYRMSLWLMWQGSAGDYQKQRRTRNAEIEAGQQWHLQRAIANVDSDNGVVRMWRFADDPGTRFAEHAVNEKRTLAEHHTLDRDDIASMEGLDPAEKRAFRRRKKSTGKVDTQA